MHDLSHGIGPRIIVRFGESKFFIITESVCFAVLLAIVLILLALWMTNSMQRVPTKKQAVAEFIVEFIYNMTRNTMGAHNMAFAPYIGTIFIFVIFGNMLGMFGFRPITADANTTFALSTITFFLIEYNSWRSMGVKRKLHHMCEPFPVYIGAVTMFPLKIIESLSRPLSLGFRLFGNIFGGVMVMALIFTGLGTFCHFLGEKIVFFHYIPLFEAVIPLPANVFFDLFEPIVQAYIFTMLTMVFISIEMVKHGDGEHH